MAINNGPYYAPGAYIGEITAQALGKAGTGNPQLVIQFRVLGKPDPKNPQDYIPVQEYQRTIYQTITTGTMDFVTEDLQQLGYDREGIGPFDPSHPDHQSFTGKQIDLWCKHENDQQGNSRERWRLSRGAPALKVEPLDTKAIRELDALFGKSLKKGKPQTQARQANSQPVVPVAAGSLDGMGITDDDVPF